MKGALARHGAAGLEAGRAVGFFLLLVGGSAALGLAIALPLWAFATAYRTAYTIGFLSVAAAGSAAFVVRGVVRRHRSVHDSGRPRRSALSIGITILVLLMFLAGLYLVAVLLYRSLWILAIPALALWASLLGLLGWAARVAKRRKAPRIPADTRSE
jgi:Flp pilus assembly protein TadB